MVTSKLVFLLGFALALEGGASAQMGGPACLNGLATALASGSFSGSLDCKASRLTLKKIGTVRKFGRDFVIYDYRYLLQPACPECAQHGGQRVIFMEGGQYLGQYKPDDAKIIIRHGDVLLLSNNKDGFEPTIVIDFTAHGPRDKLWFEGEWLRFFR